MRRGLATAVVLAVGFGTAAAPVSEAIPPRVCGKVSHKGKRYVVHAHIVKCSFSLTWAKRYLKRRAVPEGYKCNAFEGPQPNLPWVCRNRRASYITYWVTT